MNVCLLSLCLFCGVCSKHGIQLIEGKKMSKNNIGVLSAPQKDVNDKEMTTHI